MGVRKWGCLGVALVGVLAVAAPAGAAKVTEFPLESKSISSVAQAPDGTIVYSASHPYGGTASNGPGWLGFVGRIGQNGPLGETAVPPSFPGDIAVGSEGDAYLTPSSGGIARLTPSGEWSSTAARQTASERSVSPAAGGGVWFVQRSDQTVDTVGRISAAGQVSEFPIPSHESGPHAIVEGHEGDAWFTEYFADKIGRVTPSGQITEFPVPKGTGPYDITVDGGGNIWFTGLTATSIGRISPEGMVAMFPLPSGVNAGAIAAGPDGRIWFTEVTRREPFRGIGRIGPIGHYSEVPLPDAASDPVDLISGAEGNIWYAAMGQGPCEGGGGSCSVWKPEKPAIVGRITVTPLRAAVAKDRAPVWRNRVNVAITCTEGDASETCEGWVEVKVGGRTVARSRYLASSDSMRQNAVRRVPHAPSLLKVISKRRRALIVLHPDTGGRVRRALNLLPQS
jgi:virginiamycin B lyase